MHIGPRAPGGHEIAVKKQGFAGWTRKLNVTGGNVHLNVELEAATPAPRPPNARAPSVTLIPDGSS